MTGFWGLFSYTGQASWDMVLFKEAIWTFSFWSQYIQVHQVSGRVWKDSYFMFEGSPTLSLGVHMIPDSHNSRVIPMQKMKNFEQLSLFLNVLYDCQQVPMNFHYYIMISDECS